MTIKRSKSDDKKRGKIRRGPCPCSSGRPYRECCEPAHLGTAVRDAVSLMRSRYSAFALGQVGYLVQTLHPEHEDRKLGADAIRLGVQMTAASMRFTGLEIVEAREQGDNAVVLFIARVFEQGKDRSFVERSDFGRTADGWRYRAGKSRSRSEIDDLDALSIDTFDAGRGD